MFRGERVPDENGEDEKAASYALFSISGFRVLGEEPRKRRRNGKGEAVSAEVTCPRCDC